MAKIGIDRRVYTSGDAKVLLDPFQPEKPEDVARLQAIQKDVHDVFIGVVKDRRAERLKGHDSELFSGAFWSAAKALELGLIDGVSDVRTKMRELHGDDVQLKLVPFGPSGWLSRFFRFPRLTSASETEHVERLPYTLAEDLLSAIEARALWSRYGL